MGKCGNGKMRKCGNGNVKMMGLLNQVFIAKAWLFSGWTAIRLQIESNVNHGCNKLVLLLTIATLSAGNANWFAYFIGSVA